MPFRILLNGSVFTSLIMFVVFATMSLIALSFPDKAKLMPLIVGIPGTILALVQLFIELRSTLGQTAETADLVREIVGAERQMFTWMFLFFFGILGFGFIYAAPLLVFGFLWFGKEEPLKVGLVGGTATWGILYGLFQRGFEIPLFDGLLLEWLVG